MKNIYILLTRSQTIVSRLVHLSTGDTYTHASIAWDDELTTLCGFARRYSALCFDYRARIGSASPQHFILYGYAALMRAPLHKTPHAYGDYHRRVHYLYRRAFSALDGHRRAFRSIACKRNVKIHAKIR